MESFILIETCIHHLSGGALNLPNLQTNDAPFPTCEFLFLDWYPQSIEFFHSVGSGGVRDSEIVTFTPIDILLAEGREQRIMSGFEGVVPFGG